MEKKKDSEKDFIFLKNGYHFGIGFSICSKMDRYLNPPDVWKNGDDGICGREMDGIQFVPEQNVSIYNNFDVGH
jgi:hypothetical protein